MPEEEIVRGYCHGLNKNSACHKGCPLKELEKKYDWQRENQDRLNKHKKEIAELKKQIKIMTNKFSNAQLENMREVEKKRLSENERVVDAKPSIESIKKIMASSEIDSLNLTIHELKTLPEFYQPLVERKKNFEIRYDDRNFQVGDYLLLKEYSYEYKDGIKIEYTGRENTVEVTYILRAEGSFFSFLDDYVIMGIKF